MTDQNAAIADLSFEKAMEELEKIVRNLEGSAIGLEQSIQEYTRGVALKNHCEAKLKDAAMRVEKLSLNATTGKPQRDLLDAS